MSMVTIKDGFLDHEYFSGVRSRLKKMSQRYQSEGIALEPGESQLVALEGADGLDLAVTLADRLNARLVVSRKSWLHSQTRWSRRAQEKLKMSMWEKLEQSIMPSQLKGELEMILLPDAKDVSEYCLLNQVSNQASRVIVTPSPMRDSVAMAFAKEARARLHKSKVFAGDLTSVLKLGSDVVTVVRAR